MDLVSGINLENSPPLAVGQVPAKKRKKHHKPHEDCQNCGTKLTGEYCHECGQHGHVHRSLLHVIEEVFHGITHFDSRTWRSLPMLVFRPGTLTRNYVMGKRARYVPPFAMFLFTIFMMFLVFAFSGGPGLVAHVPSTKEEAIATAKENLADLESDLRDEQGDVRDAQQELASAQADTDAAPGDIGAARGVLAGAMARQTNAQRRVDEAKAALNAAIAAPDPKAAPVRQGAAIQTESSSPTFATQEDKDKALKEIAASKEKALAEGSRVEVAALTLAENVARAAPVVAQADAPSAQQANVQGKSQIEVNFGSKDGKADQSENILEMLKASMRRGDFINTPWPEINEKIKHKTENPDLFIYKLQNTAYKFSFLFVPLSLPFLWFMLFWKRGVTLFDHAVFSLYSLSFVSFLFILISLGNRVLPIGQLFGAAAIILPIHMFFQFKGAYQLKWFSAFWRTTLFCGFFSPIVITTFLLAIIALGVTG